MSGQAMMWGWKLVGHTPQAKLLAIYIGDWCDPEGNSRVEIERACLWVGLSESEFGAALAELSVSGLTAGTEENGYVECRLPIAVPPPTGGGFRAPDEPGHLYVITAGGKVKIGISRNVEQRLVWLQSGNPNEISVALKLPDPSIRRLRAIERETHRRLADRRIAGEWFDVAPDTAIQVVQEVARETTIS